MGLNATIIKQQTLIPTYAIVSATKLDNTVKQMRSQTQNIGWNLCS